MSELEKKGLENIAEETHRSAARRIGSRFDDAATQAAAQRAETADVLVQLGAASAVRDHFGHAEHVQIRSPITAYCRVCDVDLDWPGEDEEAREVVRLRKERDAAREKAAALLAQNSDMFGMTVRYQGLKRALKLIAGPSGDSTDPFMEDYRDAGGGYDGLQAIAKSALAYDDAWTRGEDKAVREREDKMDKDLSGVPTYDHGGGDSAEGGIDSALAARLANAALERIVDTYDRRAASDPDGGPDWFALELRDVAAAALGTPPSPRDGDEYATGLRDAILSLRTKADRGCDGAHWYYMAADHLEHLLHQRP